jgi:hypothetical protein
MLTSPDFKELLNLLEKYKVRYLVVGGYAVMKYTEPRFTKDLDVWVSTDTENSKAVYAALKEFGAPLKKLTPADFVQEGYFYQMGRPPFRLDVMMSIPGVTFETAEKPGKSAGWRIGYSVHIKGGFDKSKRSQR